MIDDWKTLILGLELTLVCSVLFATRRLILRITPSAIFIFSYVLFNYIGVMLFAFFPDVYYWVVPDTTFDPSAETFLKAGTIASMGLIAALLGITISTNRETSQKPVTGSESQTLPALPAGFSIPLTLCLLLFTGVFAFGTIPVNPSFILSALSDNDHLAIGSLRDTSSASRIYAMVAFNILPFLAIVLWTHLNNVRKLFPLQLVLLLIALLSRFSCLQKQPVIVLILCIGFIWIELRKRKDAASGAKYAILFSFCFIVLVGLYLITTILDMEGSIYHAVSRSFGRTSIVYVLYAELFPSQMDFYGFTNIETLMQLTGRTPFQANRELFFLFTGESTGSMATDSLLNYYGAYGFAGLIGGSFIQGMLLGVVDKWMDLGRPTVLRCCTKVFILSSCFYLAETTIFGAALGFGGAVFAVLHWVLRRPTTGHEQTPMVNLVAATIPLNVATSSSASERIQN
jgi:hypothetical protein